jgi:hypothetical protein
MKPRILITIEGGVVQSVNSNCDIELVILDYDGDGEEEPVIIQHGDQDGLFATGKAYKLLEKSFPMSDGEKEAYEFLNEIKF